MDIPQPFEGPIRLQPRPQTQAGVPAAPMTPEDRMRANIRGAIVMGKEKPMPPDHLWPNLWSATAYDSFKYSRLRKIAFNLLDKAIETGARTVAVPLHIGQALLRHGGLPVDEATQDPEQLQSLVHAVSQGPADTFLPHGHTPAHHPHHHKRGSSMEMTKEEFIRKYAHEFEEAKKIADEKTAGIMSIFGKKEPSLGDSIGHGLQAAGNFMRDKNVHQMFSSAGDFIQKHPLAGGLAAAGATAAGMGLYNAHQQSQQLPKHQHALKRAYEIFPELHHEDPKKIHLLWSSAVHVAPEMSKNPMLLGTWIKSLAQGFAGTHLGAADLKQLQDLEVQHVGKPKERQGMLGNMGTAMQAVTTGSTLAGLMHSVQQGRNPGNGRGNNR